MTHLERYSKVNLSRIESTATTGQVHEINYNPNLTVSSVKESDDWWDKTKDVIVNALGLAGDIATVVGVVVMLPEATVAGAVALVGAGILAVADAIFKAFNIGESITGTNIIKEWLGEVQYLTTEDIVETAATIASFGVGVVNVGGLSNIGKMAGKGLKALKNAAGEFIEGFTKKVAKEAVENNVDELAKTASSIGSKLQDVLELASKYSLSDDVYNNHILKLHGPNSVYNNKSHFVEDFDIKTAIDSTLMGDNFIVGPNTNGRAGYIFEQTFSYQIGTNSRGNPLYTIKVVIDELGNVVTAFPKK